MTTPATDTSTTTPADVGLRQTRRPRMPRTVGDGDRPTGRAAASGLRRPRRVSLVGWIGRWCFHHARVVVALWLAAVLAAFALAGVVGASFESSASVPGAESAHGAAVLAEHFPELGAGGQAGTIVFRADQGVEHPDVAAAMEELFATVDAGFPDGDGRPTEPGATVVSPYAPAGREQIARSGPLAGELAFAQVNLSAEVDDTRSGRIGTAIAEAAPVLAGLEVHVGGQFLAEVDPPKAELLGLAFAAVVLVAAFGSVVAMGLPIAVALGGVGVGLASIVLLSNVVTMPEEAVVLALMVGIGVGIDYALFIVTRYRSAVASGLAPPDAVEQAAATAGRAVLFAGSTVVVSLAGLLLVGLGWLGGMGVGVSVTVVATMAASATLLPALVAMHHRRLEATCWRGVVAVGFAALALVGVGLGVPVLGLAGAVSMVVTLVLGSSVPALRRPVRRRAPQPIERTAAHRWSRAVQRRPARWLLAASLLLVVLAAPAIDLRLGWADEGNWPVDSSTRQAYDLLAEGFGPGSNGPLIVTAVGDRGTSAAAVADLRTALVATPGVAAVSTPVASAVSSGERTGVEAHVMTVTAHTAPQDEATTDLVRTLRSEVVPAAAGGLEVSVSGGAAAAVDVTDHLSDRLPVVVAAVLAVSFVVLMVVFRSVLVPLKAVGMNLASVAAAYGVVVAVFQWGWGAGLLGIEGGPINPFIPLMLFAIVFGLSMDYEVFLLSRIREAFDRTGDPVGSVADGLAATARVITTAAAIMVVVFTSFVLGDIREIKIFGLGLAVAVLVDATVVRMVVAPATMALLGERNWWLPRPLERLVPRLTVEPPS